MPRSRSNSRFHPAYYVDGHDVEVWHQTKRIAELKSEKGSRPRHARPNRGFKYAARSSPSVRLRRNGSLGSGIARGPGTSRSLYLTHALKTYRIAARYRPALR